MHETFSWYADQPLDGSVLRDIEGLSKPADSRINFTLQRNLSLEIEFHDCDNCGCLGASTSPSYAESSSTSRTRGSIARLKDVRNSEQSSSAEDTHSDRWSIHKVNHLLLRIPQKIHSENMLKGINC